MGRLADWVESHPMETMAIALIITGILWLLGIDATGTGRV